MAEQFEEMFKDRLLDIALRRRKALHEINDHRMTSRITAEMVVHSDEPNIYEVESESVLDCKYTVDTLIVRCTCVAGIGGKFCKHIAAVERFFPGSIAIDRMSTAPERYQVALLAVGNGEVPEPQFFGCTDEQAAELRNRSDNSLVVCSAEFTSAEQGSEADAGSSGDDFEEPLSDKATIAMVEAAAQQWKALVLQHKSDPNVVSGVLAMQKTMGKISNSNALATSLHTFGKSWVGAGKSSRRIPVQPTAIARRREGEPRGASALSKGRPRKRKAGEAKMAFVPHKRRRMLAFNVALNQPNGKSHGTGH